VGCGPQGTPAVPTAAALPTVTPTPLISPTPSPTEQPFLTATPTEMPSPADMPDGDQPTSVASEDTPSLFTSPTPEGAAGSSGAGDQATPAESETGPCSGMAFNASLNATDLIALDADLQAFVSGLLEGQAALGGWTPDTTLDPFTTAGIQGVLPQASLRFRREMTVDGESLPQDAFLLVARLDGPLRTYFNRCIADEAYFRQSDVSSAAAVTITPLEIGDRGALAVIVEAADPEAGDSGLGDLTTEVYAVLAGDTLYQLVNIPALAAAVGQSPITREDAEGLLRALVDAASS
jgi:hypothetical protein